MIFLYSYLQARKSTLTGVVKKEYAPINPGIWITLPPAFCVCMTSYIMYVHYDVLHSKEHVSMSHIIYQQVHSDLSTLTSRSGRIQGICRDDSLYTMLSNYFLEKYRLKINYNRWRLSVRFVSQSSDFKKIICVKYVLVCWVMSWWSYEVPFMCNLARFRKKTDNPWVTSYV